MSTTPTDVPFARFVAVLLVATACACLHTVASVPDSGGTFDASLDAGKECVTDRDCPIPDAGCTYVQCLYGWCTNYVYGICDGGVQDCVLASDCHGGKESVPWCSQPDAGASFSCIAGSCVWECPGKRTCSTDLDAGCLDCVSPGTSICIDGGACLNPLGVATVESSTCANPVVTPPAPFTGTSLTFQALADCRSEASISEGPPIGGIVELSSGQFIGDFSPLGGACTGELLPTNVVRLLINCPTCQFVVRF
jgi:hypothetical protein